MNDRFKFRIPMFTDKDTFVDFQYIELGEPIECTLCGYNKEPQQCIGRKDKDGTLIFEGDVIEANYGRCYTDRKGITRCGIVKYCDSAFKMHVFNSAYKCSFESMIKNTIKIVGNIYDNPELLEALK